MSHLALRQRLGTLRTISSLPFVLWRHRLSRGSSLSFRQCNRLHNRSRTCLGHCFRQARQARHTNPTRTPCLDRRLDPAVVCQRVSLACPRQLQWNCLRLLRWHFQFVLTRTFRRICSALTGHSNRRFRMSKFVSPVQIVFEPLRVRRSQSVR